MNVQGEGQDQADPHDPQGDVAGEDRIEQFAEGVAVLVDLVDAARFRPEEDLEVADEVGDHEADQQDAR